MEEQAGGALLRGGGSNDWMVLALCDEKGEEEATRTATTVGCVVLCSSYFESRSVMSLSTLCSHTTWIAWMPPPSLVHQLLVSSVT